MRSISKGVQIAVILFGVGGLLMGCSKTEPTETKPATTVNTDGQANPGGAKMTMPSKKDFNDGKN